MTKSWLYIGVGLGTFILIQFVGYVSRYGWPQ